MLSSPGPIPRVSSAGERGREEISGGRETLEGLQAVKEVPERIAHLKESGVPQAEIWDSSPS